MDDEDANFLQNFRDEVEGIVLPKWFSDLFPPHLPWSIIAFKDGKFHVSHDGSMFDDIAEAYDYVSCFSSDYQVVFDSSVDGHSGELLDRIFLCDIPEGGRSGRLLPGQPTEDVEAVIKHDFRHWLTETSLEYNADPDDFVSAHNWLDCHPIFWTVQGRGPITYRSWATSSGMRHVRVRVWFDENTKEPGVFMEAGPHIAPDYRECGINYKLCSYATTYEQAVIELAKKVNELYDLDGNPR